MGRMLAWAGVVLGAVYLIYVGGGWWGIYSPYLRIVTVALAALILVVWAAAAIRIPAWRPRTVLWPAIAACLGSLAISTVFSRVPRVSLEYLGYAVVLAALYLLLVRLFANEFFQRRLATLFSMLFVISAALYVATVIGGWIEWWQLAGLTVPPLRPGFGGLTYNNPSAALTMVALLAVPAIATFGLPTRRGLVVIGAIVVTVGVVALMSGSRSGWLALGITAVIGTLAWLAGRTHRDEAADALRAILRQRRGQVAVIGVLTGTLGLAAVIGPAVIRRATEGGENLRISYAVAASRMFAESPIVGTGPGTWVIQRPALTAAGEADYYIPHAHNLEVQALAELGLVGAAAGVILVAALLRLFLGAMRGPGGERRRWAWAGALGLAYFALHQLLDFYVNMPAFLFASAIPIAYLDATHSPSPAEPGGARRPSWPSWFIRVTRGASVAVVAVALGGLLLQEVPAVRQAEAVALATANDWRGADGPARAAAALDPAIGSYQFTAGLTAARAGDHAAAAAYFANVTAANDLPEAWLNLAAEQVELGDPDAARASLVAALRLGDQRQAITMPAGDLALRIGDVATATRAFAAAVAGAPSLAADSWWQDDAARAGLFPQVVASAAQIAPVNAWEIFLMTGQPVAVPPSDLALTITRAWQGDAVGLEALLGHCSASPLALDLLTWCARVTRHLGDEIRSDAFRTRVAIISIGLAGWAGELRVSPNGMVGSQLPGGPADLWATYTYRRPAPWDVLVPTLVHLRLE